MKRRKSLPVQAGSVTIGGDAPVSVQTMSTVNPAHMAEAVVDARRLASYGAEILRFAVPDMEAAKGLAAVVQAVDIPIVADIHFDYRLALAAVDSGVQALRINRAISDLTTMSSKSSKKYVLRESPPVSASIQVPCRKISWLRAAAIRRQKAWSKGPCAISASWNAWITATWSFPSSPPTCP